MKKKFEIRSHDGPGRIGKIDSEPTPKLFFKNDLKIAPNQGSAHNVDREIAEFNVKETLRLAEENVDEGLAFPVLQGPEAGAGKGREAGARREAPSELPGFGQRRAVPGLPALGLGREAARSACLAAAVHGLSLLRPGSLPR